MSCVLSYASQKNELLESEVVLRISINGWREEPGREDQ